MSNWAINVINAALEVFYVAVFIVCLVWIFLVIVACLFNVDNEEDEIDV